MKMITTMMTLALLAAPAAPAMAADIEFGAALGVGVYNQHGGAPPLCCGERDEWSGLTGTAEARLALPFDWFALVMGVGIVGVTTDEADYGSQSYSGVSPIGRLSAEMRGGSSHWRVRGGLGGGLAFEAPSVSAYGAVEGSFSDVWIGAELRGEGVVASGTAFTAMATVWF